VARRESREGRSDEVGSLCYHEIRGKKKKKNSSETSRFESDTRFSSRPYLIWAPVTTTNEAIPAVGSEPVAPNKAIREADGHESDWSRGIKETLCLPR
jgi:hypothetical protein